MDGFSDNTRKPIFVVAATNFDASFGSNDLDPAVLRRFDYKIKIENPNKEERLDFINKLIEKSKITSLSSEMIESIAIRSNGWNYSDLTKLINEIKKKSIDLSSSNLTQNDNNELLNEIFESFTDGEHKKIKKTDLEHIAYHEAGHALVSYLLGKTPDYVTINSRGNYGGFVFNSYEGKFDFTKDEMLNQICITLAGRASEMAIFNDKGITTGASNDIRMANDLAKNMYNNYGMVEDNLYISDTKNLDKSAKEIISKLLKEEMTRANELITSNLDLLKIIANKLLNSGYITSLDFDNLMKGVA